MHFYLCCATEKLLVHSQCHVLGCPCLEGSRTTWFFLNKYLRPKGLRVQGTALLPCLELPPCGQVELTSLSESGISFHKICHFTALKKIKYFKKPLFSIESNMKTMNSFHSKVKSHLSKILTFFITNT